MDKNNKFIKSSIDIHGDKYDYSLVDYKNNKTKVKIICHKHGIFEQRPIGHINSKNGCPDCYGNLKSNVFEFIDKSINIHGDKYDYSLVKYINDKEKVTIICHKHGEFYQTPNTHLSGHGCFTCANKNDLDTFLLKCEEIYGNEYDYSLVEYININTPVIIKCKIHGGFSIKPAHFLYEKNGCIYCSKKTYKDIYFFEKDANKIHNNKYKYEIITDLKMNSFINVICKTHGKFKQKIRSHIYAGCGCPNCKESIGEKEINSFLSKRNIEFIRQHKFPDCKNKYPLSFDFYIPSEKICIEYDGVQHFEMVKFFGGQKRFEDIKNNDDIKNKYCKNNNLKLLRIPYYDYDKIEIILSEFLNPS